MTFPKWDEASATSTRALGYFLDSGDCQIQFIEPQNDDENIECTIQENAGTYEDGNYYDDVVITNRFGEDIGQGVKLEFVISNVRNPPSTRGTDKIDIRTEDADGVTIDVIDKESCNCPYQPTEPSLLTAADYRLIIGGYMSGG